LKILTLTFVSILITTFSIQAVNSQTSLTTVNVVPAQNTMRIGETMIVNVTITNVQNLYGLDINLEWNNSLLQLMSANSWLGVESHPGGVLHESTDAPISVVEDDFFQEAGEYHLVATSQNPSPSFNGSGTIVTLTFNVTSIGHSALALQSELADRPLPDQISEFIAHTDASGSVDAGAIPEFPELIIIGFVAIFVTIALVFSSRILKKKSLKSI
jgi:hypothetical protein